MRRLVILILTAAMMYACGSTSKVQQLPAMSLESDLGLLASDEFEGRETGTDGEKKSAEYIAGRFEKIGLQPKGSDGYFHEFEFLPHPPVQVHGSGDSATVGMAVNQKLTGTNVVGYYDKGAAKTIVIGAHHDHLGWGGQNSLHTGDKQIHNGADDNASGVATLLALAESITSSESEYKYNFLFIAFSGEEFGLWGSKAWVKDPTINLEDINCMINMDMVGRLNKENTIVINGVGTAPEWNKAIKKIKSGLNVKTTESGIGPSDQTSFYLEDIPAIHFFTGQHDDYHKPSDDSDKVNYAGMRQVVSYIYALVDQIADKPAFTFTKTKDEEQKQRSFNVTLGVMPDYTFTDEGMRIDGVKEDRAAHSAGLIKGDIVVRMGEYPVKNMNDYMDCLGKFNPGETTEVEVIRNEENLKFNVLWD